MKNVDSGRQPLFQAIRAMRRPLPKEAPSAMLETDAVKADTRDGIEGWYYPHAGRWLPRIAGADDTDADPNEDPAKPGQDTDPERDPAKPDPAKADDELGAPAKADDELGAKGKAALEAERKRGRDEKKRADAAEKKLKQREDADADETEKAKKRAEEAESKVSAATDKLRRANLLASLAEEGLTGAKAKAAARLLDDVEYDESTDEPTNLQDAIKAATAEYGEDMFKGAKPKPKPPASDGGEGNEDRDGPQLTADELAAAKAAGMTAEEYVEFSKPNPALPAKKTSPKN